MMRRLSFAFLLALSLSPALGQVPPPVPALPDTERRTSYSISASTCACAVGFQLYGDSTDVANWLEVFVNGVLVPQAGGWTISSPTGPIATIPRPITDAVLTFAAAQTGTVQIVGARRPRRTSQFSESRGVAARDLNQAITDLVAMLREEWDKTNDITGRAVRAPPGETLKLLPVLAGRQNMGACFDSSGNLTSCVAAPSSGSFAAGFGIVFTGTNPTTISCSSPFTSSQPGCVPASGGIAGTFLGSNGLFAAPAPGAVFGGYFDVVKTYGADPTGVASSTVAINNAIHDACGTTPSPGTGGVVWIQPGTYLVNGGLNLTNIQNSCHIMGAGITSAVLTVSSATNAIFDMVGAASVTVSGLQINSSGGFATYGIILAASSINACDVNHFQDISISGSFIEIPLYIYGCSDGSFTRSSIVSFNKTSPVALYISNVNTFGATSTYATIKTGTVQAGDWNFFGQEIHDLSTFSPATTSTVTPLYIAGAFSPVKFYGGLVAGSPTGVNGGYAYLSGTTGVSFAGTQFYADNGISGAYAFSNNGNTVTGLTAQNCYFFTLTGIFGGVNSTIWKNLNVTGNANFGGVPLFSVFPGNVMTLTQSIVDAQGQNINMGAAGVVTHTVMLFPGTITAATQTANGSF